MKAINSLMTTLALAVPLAAPLAHGAENLARPAIPSPSSSISTGPAIAANSLTMIHAAWAGGWQWGYVEQSLRQAGIISHAPDLPGHGSDKTPLAQISMDSYVNKMVQELDKLSEPTILVAHSFGGVVASQVAQARPEKVAAIVYLCAFMLPNDTSFLDATKNIKDSQVLNNLEFSTDQKSVVIKPSARHAALAKDVPTAAFAGAEPNLVAEPVAPLASKLQLTDARYGKIVRYYVECTNDHALPLHAQKQMVAAMPVEKVYRLASSHMPMFAMPDKVAEILADVLAREKLRVAVREGSRQWQQAFNRGDAKAASALYEVDAEMHAAPMGRFKGRQAIQGFWTKLIADGFSDVEYLNPQISIIDKSRAKLKAGWKMNQASGTINEELWVMQADGTVALRKDHFRVK